MRSAFVLVTLLVVSSAFGQSKIYTPKVGSVERKAILDGFREKLKKPLSNKPVVFKVQSLKTDGQWAFYYGAPRQPNGKMLNYKGTEFEDAYNSDAFDDNCGALLKRSGKKWTVKAWFLGATDVPWVDWPEHFKAPKGIFPKF